VKVGDLVQCWAKPYESPAITGIIIGFNEKGFGGKDFVHVLCDDGTVQVFMNFDVNVVKYAKR